MSPDQNRWHDIDRLFDQYLEKKPSEQVDFIEAVRTDHPDLFEAFMELVQTSKQADDFLEERASEFVTEDYHFPGSAILQSGQVVGPYTIDCLLGSGGMGAVYKATRLVNGIRQDVALKVLNANLAPERHHLERESQILAQLQHPHITAFLDSGRLDAGPSYLVMELVQGKTLDGFCNDKQLDIPSRIRIFIEILDAISFAHKNLVVHRDLKPANILVTPDGLPKVLDFGIARIIDQQTGLQAQQTQTNLRCMTPAYASPEQLRGAPISVATDIYALGLILYEILVGQLPHKSTSSNYELLEQIIKQSNRPKPSQAVIQTQPTWKNKLKGDLDAIVMKAIQYEPGERYSSVEALKEDLERFLNGQPVKVRQSSWTYRTTRTLWHHKWATGFTFLTFAFLLTTMFLMQQHTRSLQRANEKSTRVISFLKGLFQSVDPTIAQGEPLTLEDVLQRGTQDLGRALEEEPDIESELLQTLGTIYINLGDFKEAENQYSKAAQICKKNAGKEGAEWAKAASLLGLVYVYETRYDEAQPLIETSYQILKEKQGENHYDTLVALNRLGLLERSRGDLLHASEIFKQVIAKGPGDSKLTRVTKQNLIGIWIDLKQWEQAEHLLKEQIQLAKSEGDKRFLLSFNGQLVKVLQNSNRLEEAGILAEEQIALAQRVFGKDHQKTAECLHVKGGVLLSQNRFKEAIACFESSMEISKKNLPEKNPFLSVLLNSLGNAYELQGLFEQALSYLEESQQINRALYKGDHPNIAVGFLDLANVHQQLGHYEKAEKYHLEAIAMSRRLLGPKHAASLVSPTYLGFFYFLSGRSKEALPLFMEASTVLTKRLGELHPKTLAANHGLAWVRFQLGETETALKLFQDVVQKRRMVLGANNPDLATSLHSLAWVEYTLKDYEPARTHLEEAISIRRKVFGDSNPDLAWSLNNLGLVIQAQGHPDQARELLEEGRSIRQATLGQNHHLYIQSLNNLILNAEARSDGPEALKLYEEVINLAEKIWGRDSQQVGTLIFRQAKTSRTEGNVRQALLMFKKANDLFTDHNDWPQKQDVQLEYAMTLLDVGDFKELKSLAHDDKNTLVSQIAKRCVQEDKCTQLRRFYQAANWNQPAATTCFEKE